jgi:hypothetical protein
MVKGTQASGTSEGHCRTKSFEKMDVWKDVSDETRTQKCDKEPRVETAAMKQEGIHQDLQENHWTEIVKQIARSSVGL